MTREEAIKILKEFKTFCEGILWDSKYIGRVEALDMVIESLSAPSGDLISRQDAIDAIPDTTADMFENCRNCKLLDREQVIDILSALPSADVVKRVDCSNFLLWLLEEIMDEENWELNAVSDGEIIARKLKKLGLLEVKDGYYHRIFDENVWVVRCKDCRHRCKEPIYSKADVHWVIYQIGDCPIICKTVGDDDYCSFGERREL